MAMGKRTVNSLGVLGVAIILGGAYFGLAAPVLTERSSTELEYEQAQQLSLSYTGKLSSFQNGQSEESRAATETMELFQGLVSETLDIESASRAIAASLPGGVKLESFDFGSAQQVASLQEAPLGIDGFTAPPEFAEGAGATPAAPAPESQEDAVESAGGTAENPVATAVGEQGVNPDAPISGFNRIPFTIKVSASSYIELSAYLNSLAEQPRLMSVVSVDSNSTEGAVTATVYAFAFSGR